MEIWTAFIVGFFGSLHCIGMCGPIALALPVYNEPGWRILITRLLYNLGRVTTYTLLGALFGLFGSRLILFGLQQDLSVFFGIVILIFLFTPRKIRTRLAGTKFYTALSTFIITHFSSLASQKSVSSFYAIGMLNGLLPCGFVYVGIAGAVSTGGIISGAAYMFLFGMGTFPVMLAASALGKFIDIKRRVNKLIPYLAGLLALLFILRGLNLGIPFLSPKFSKAPAAVEQLEDCH